MSLNNLTLSRTGAEFVIFTHDCNISKKKKKRKNQRHVREAVAAAMSSSARASQSREVRVTTRMNMREYYVCV